MNLSNWLEKLIYPEFPPLNLETVHYKLTKYQTATVMEGLCPFCKKELQRKKHDPYYCSKCGAFFAVP